MKNLNKLAVLAVCFLFLFSVFSGCKTKHKLLKTSTIENKTVTSSVDSSRVIKSTTVQEQKTDSSKVVNSSKKTDEQSNTIELHFKLDSTGKRASIDTAGNFDIRKLINAGLQSASSLIIKIKDKQKHTQEDSNTKQDLKKLNSSTSSLSDSSKVKKAAEKRDIKESKKDLDLSKDSTVVKNAGGPWVVIAISIFVIAGLVFLIKR
jgi:hypothetical protein